MGVWTRDTNLYRATKRVLPWPARVRMRVIVNRPRDAAGDAQNDEDFRNIQCAHIHPYSEYTLRFEKWKVSFDTRNDISGLEMASAL